MNAEKLQTAKNLEESINKLKMHRKRLTEDNQHKWTQIKVSARYTSDSHIDDLYESFMPISYADIKTLYLMKLEARIKELETEFANL
ncbi:MAG: hypothetical protein V4549_07585 [Bacteroidota bacterium]